MARACLQEKERGDRGRRARSDLRYFFGFLWGVREEKRDKKLGHYTLVLYLERNGWTRMGIYHRFPRGPPRNSGSYSWSLHVNFLSFFLLPHSSVKFKHRQFMGNSGTNLARRTAIKAPEVLSKALCSSLTVLPLSYCENFLLGSGRLFPFIHTIHLNAWDTACISIYLTSPFSFLSRLCLTRVKQPVFYFSNASFSLFPA